MRRPSTVAWRACAHLCDKHALERADHVGDKVVQEAAVLGGGGLVRRLAVHRYALTLQFGNGRAPQALEVVCGEGRAVRNGAAKHAGGAPRRRRGWRVLRTIAEHEGGRILASNLKQQERAARAHACLCESSGGGWRSGVGVVVEWRARLPCSGVRKGVGTSRAPNSRKHDDGHKQGTAKLATAIGNNLACI